MARERKRERATNIEFYMRATSSNSHPSECKNSAYIREERSRGRRVFVMRFLNYCQLYDRRSAYIYYTAAGKEDSLILICGASGGAATTRVARLAEIAVIPARACYIE